MYDHYRKGNPTRSVLEKCMASLDNAKYGLTYSSGMGALTTISQLLKSGDHIISSYDVIGVTVEHLTEIEKNNGIEVDFIDMRNLDTIKPAIKSNTKVIRNDLCLNFIIYLFKLHAV